MSDSVILTIVVALISSGTVGTLMTAVVKYFFDKASRENPLNTGMKLLLQDKLTHLCKQAIDDPSGKISLSRYHMMQQMYKSYKALGGNGDMERLMAAIEKLDIYIDN